MCIVLYCCIVLMGCSLLPNSLRNFEIYRAPPSLISQLFLCLRQTVEIDPLGYVRVVEALLNVVQKCDPVILSEIHIHIVGVQQFHCRSDTFCIKDLCPFQFYVDDHIDDDVL